MKTSTALMCVPKDFAPGVANLRQRMRERALDEAAMAPRVWIEALERRMMMNATAATLDLDPSFGQGGYAAPLGHSPLTDAYDHLAAAPGGKIYAVGYPYGYYSAPFDLVRLTAEGALDRTFGVGGVVQVEQPGPTLLAESVVVQGDGKVLVMAQSSPPQQVADSVLLMRFNADGTLDRGFGTGGIQTLPMLTPHAFQTYQALTLRADGKIDILDIPDDHFTLDWRDNYMRLAMWQLNADGTPDESFEPGGKKEWWITPQVSYLDNWLWHSTLQGLTTLPDGGSVAYVEFQLEGENTKPNYGGELMALRFDAEGKLVSYPICRVFALGPQGALLGFGAIYAALLPDGGAVALNAASGPWATPTGQLVHIDVNGNADQQFGVDGVAQTMPGAGFQGGVWSPFVQADGKILIELSDDRWSSNGLERFNADGSPDLSFAGGEPAFAPDKISGILDVLPMPDGSIVLSVLNRTADNTGDVASLVRLKPEGGTPNTFDLQSYNPDLYDPGVGDTPPPDSAGGTTADGGNSSGNETSNDPTAGFGSLADRAGDVLTANDISLFAHSSGSSVLNPTGKHDVLDDGIGAL